MAQTKTIAACVTPQLKQEIERIAFEESEPGNHVSESELVRNAIQEYLDEKRKGAE